MQFELTKEQLMVRQLAYDFAQTEVKPVASEYDEAEEFIWPIAKMMGKLGFMGMCVPEEYGGAGADTVSYAIVVEELSRVCGGTGITVAAHNSLGTGHILKHGTDEQKAKYLPKLASGEQLSAWGLTEPNAGSDVAGIKTRAVRDGDEWVINGSKMYITNAATADWLCLLAVTDPDAGYGGFSQIIVPTDTPGFNLVRSVSVMGHAGGGGHCEIRYENCRVPASNLLGPEHGGFVIAQARLGPGRIHHCMRTIGAAERAFEIMCRYANERVAFGGPLGEKQFVQEWVATSRMEIDQ
ncbi:MAG: acyl-CoA dehydrogenase family protein, partial [Thermoplasmata archaeon]|nr:acyl-CoA dehydrogenase family protein [Thermoplasmata archaeon]